MTAANVLWDHSMNFGIYNCRQSTAGGRLSVHAEGRAADIGFPVIGGVAHPQGHLLLQVLQINAWDLGLQYIIWNRRSYTRTNPTGKTYTGPNPHIDHLHVEQTWEAAKHHPLTLETAYLLLGESMFTPDEEQVLKDIVAAIKAEGSNGSAMAALIRLVRVLRQVDDVFDGVEF